MASPKTEPTDSERIVVLEKTVDELINAVDIIRQWIENGQQHI